MVGELRVVGADHLEVARLVERPPDRLDVVEPELRVAVERTAAGRKDRRRIGESVRLDVTPHVPHEFRHAPNQRAVFVAPVAMELLLAHSRLSPHSCYELDHATPPFSSIVGLSDAAEPARDRKSTRLNS